MFIYIYVCVYGYMFIAVPSSEWQKNWQQYGALVSEKNEPTIHTYM